MFRRAFVIAIMMIVSSPALAQEGARRDDPPPPAAPTGVVTKAPVLLQAVAPAYPKEAAEAGLQADVPVKIHIDENGLVTAVDVITPQGHGFDEAAVEAALQYVFDPAEIDGVPGAIVVETTIHFVIEVVEEPEEPEVIPDENPEEDEWPEAPPGHAGDPRKPITLAGEAVERGTRSKLSGVIVSITELGLDAITDEDGKFFFHGVPAGTWTLLALDDRYDRFKRQVELAKGERVDARLWMSPSGGNPYETLVEGEREVFEVTRRTLERRQLTTVPGTFGDPIRVIQTLPGVARAPFGLGLLLIRGSNPDDTGIYLDGHRIPLLFHFLGGPSILSAELIETLDLYPSGFPARFGRAHGGVVAVETRPSKTDGIHGQADVDLLDAGFYLRAPAGKKASFAIAGRRSYVDALLPFVLPEPSPGSTRVVVPVYWDGQARFDYDLGKEGRVSLFAITSSDRLDVLTKDEEDEVDLGLNTSTRFFRFIGSYKRRLTDALDLTISPAWGRDTLTFAAGASDAQSPYLSLDIVQTTLSYRARVTGRLSKHLVLDAGLDLDSRVTEYDALVPDDSDIRGGQGIDIPPSLVRISTEGLGLGLHADLAIDVGNLRVIPGLRLDGYVLSAQTLSSIDPRITARWKASPFWTLKGYVGKFSQPPQPEAADARFGNPEIGVEHAYHFGAGAEWRPHRLWLLDVEGYYIDRRELVGFTDRSVMNPDGTIDQPFFVNEGHGFTYGLEVLIKREISERLFGWLSYTYSHSERALPDHDLLLSAFDQTHVANAVASWRPGGGWEIGARWQVATSRPDTPVVDAVYDADGGDFDPINGGMRTVRLPFFHQIDVRAEKTWLFDTWSLGVYLDVMNVINHDNVEALEYDYRFRETAPVTGIPIVPTLGVPGAVVKRFLAIALIAGCGSFEDPTIVIDNRILAITAEPPEQVFDLDPQNPPEDIDELGLVDAEVCALIADPGAARELDWTMNLCSPTGDGKCEDHGDRPYFELGHGRLEDPETAATPQVACATLRADAGLLLVLEDAIRRDELGGFSGIDVQVSLSVSPEDAAEEDLPLLATKYVRYAVRLPEERVANVNPTLDRIDIEVEDADPIVLPMGRCADQADPLRIAPGADLPLLPIEPDGVREDYVVPTFDGGSRAFTENITYQWLASAGSWNRAFSGGPHDISGAEAKLDATWFAPGADDVTEDLDVSLWILQRDERLGLRWFESCVRVTP